MGRPRRRSPALQAERRCEARPPGWEGSAASRSDASARSTRGGDPRSQAGARSRGDRPPAGGMARAREGRTGSLRERELHPLRRMRSPWPSRPSRTGSRTGSAISAGSPPHSRVWDGRAHRASAFPSSRVEVVPGGSFRIVVGQPDLSARSCTARERSCTALARERWRLRHEPVSRARRSSLSTPPTVSARRSRQRSGSTTSSWLPCSRPTHADARAPCCPSCIAAAPWRWSRSLRKAHPSSQTELRMLYALESSPLRSIVTPRALASFPWRGLDVLAMTVLSHRGRTSRALGPVETDALVELYEASDRLKAALGHTGAGRDRPRGLLRLEHLGAPQRQARDLGLGVGATSASRWRIGSTGRPSAWWRSAPSRSKSSCDRRWCPAPTLRRSL